MGGFNPTTGGGQFGINSLTRVTWSDPRGENDAQLNPYLTACLAAASAQVDERDNWAVELSK